MKHIKLFEYWDESDNTLDNILLNYNDNDNDDKSEDVIYQLKKYINNNYKNATINSKIIHSSNNECLIIGNITLYLSNNYHNEDSYIYIIVNNNTKMIQLTENEYNDFEKFLNNTFIKIKRYDNRKVQSEILDEIIPVRKEAGKYNL